MSERMSNLSGKWRQAPRGLVVVAGAAMVVALAIALLSATAGTAHGSGSGGGGCFSTSGPVCTFQNQQAFVDFGSVDATGCILSDASVEAFASLTNPGRAPMQCVFVSIFTFNQCTGVQLAGASNFDPTTGLSNFSGSMQFGSKLAGASVTGTAQMFDFNTGAAVFTTTINLTWSGFGPTTTSIDSNHVHAPGFVMNSHFHGSQRNAVASGVLTDASGANDAASPSLSAGLTNAQGGTVQLSHV